MYGQSIHSDHGHEKFTQVVGSLVPTGLMEDNRHRVEDSRSMGQKLAFTRGLSRSLLCWNRGNPFFSGIYGEEQFPCVCK